MLSNNKNKQSNDSNGVRRNKFLVKAILVTFNKTINETSKVKPRNASRQKS